jgi:hypothetical protein
MLLTNPRNPSSIHSETPSNKLENTFRVFLVRVVTVVSRPHPYPGPKLIGNVTAGQRRAAQPRLSSADRFFWLPQPP